MNNMRAKTTGRISYFSLVKRNRGFRLVWLGELVSFMGDWFSLLALYGVVQSMTDSTLALAGVVVGKMLPSFLVTPIAGPLADRFDRRRLMIFTDLVRAVLVLGFLAAYVWGQLWLLYVTLVLQTAFSGIFVPAKAAAIPRLTSKEELPVAMALSAGTWSVMLAVGAALGGVLTELVGFAGAFWLDGLTFLVSAWILKGLPEIPPEKKEDEEGSFWEGVRYIAKDSWLITLLTSKPLIMFQSAVILMLPVFGNGTFPAYRGPIWVGLLYAARGLGAFVGSVGSRHLTGDSVTGMRRAAPFALLLAGLSFGFVSWAPTYPLVALGVFCAALGSSTMWVFSSTMLQQSSEDRFRGRVFSLEWGSLTLLGALSSWGAGIAGDHGASERSIAWFIGVALMILAVCWGGLAWKTQPREPREEDGAA